MGEKKKKNLKN
jgi:hypothetical protein